MAGFSHRYAGQVDQARNRAGLRAPTPASEDPGADHFAAVVAEMERQAREASRPPDRATEQTRRYAAEVEKARARNEQFARTLRDGSYLRHARTISQLAREYQGLQRAAHLQTMVAEHGKLGAIVRANRGELVHFGQVALGVFGAAAAASVGLAHAGFQGTAEGYALSAAWERLARQIAAIAVPAVRKVGREVDYAGDKFRELSGDQQDALLNVGLLAVGGIAAGKALRFAAGGAAALWSVARRTGAILGTRGAAAAAPAIAAGAESAAGGAAAGAGGGLAATAGGRLLATGGLALGGGLLRGLFGPEVAGGVGAGVAGLGALRGGLSAVGPMGGTSLRAVGAGALRGGLKSVPLLAGASLWDASENSYYSMLRNRGNNKAIAGIGALGGGFINTLTFGAFADHLRRKGDLPAAGAAEGAKKGESHRDVTPASFDQEDPGGYYFRLQQEVMKQTAGAGIFKEDDSPGLLQRIVELLEGWERRLGLSDRRPDGR